MDRGVLARRPRGAAVPGPAVAGGRVVGGIALLVKPLMAFLLVALVVAVLATGPRPVLSSRWLWAGALLTVAVAGPYVGWQATHGWPQLEMGRAIADGSSGSSEPRWALLPFQLLLVPPVLAPVWLTGLVRLFRDPDVRPVRFLGWTYVVLAVTFLVTGGRQLRPGGDRGLAAAGGAGAAGRRLPPARSAGRRGGADGQLRRGGCDRAVRAPACACSAVTTVTPTGGRRPTTLHRSSSWVPRTSGACCRAVSRSGSWTTASVWTTTRTVRPSGCAAGLPRPGGTSGRACAASAEVFPSPPAPAFDLCR